MAGRLCTVSILKNSAKDATPPKTSPEPVAAKPSAPPTPVYNSAATPTAPSEAVGPGASKSGDYKNTEYYCYNDMSYFDLEAEMVKDRIPQPKSGNELY